MPASALFFALLTILLWSFLALLGAGTNHLPPMLVTGVALTLSGLLGGGLGLLSGRLPRGALPARRLPPAPLPLRTLAVGVYGLFGYHVLYFAALSLAPVVEANLLNYLWPLLIVLLAPVFLPGVGLRPHHLLGAGLGLAGAGLIVSGGRLSLDLANLPGYLSAAGAAFVWASYSLLTRRLPPFPTAAVARFCLVSGLLSLGLHFALAGPGAALPRGQDWPYLVLLGLGPLGAAFFTWDAALKRGDPRIIGSLAYLTPLTSTLLLVLAGGRSFTWISALAMALIVAGALLGSLDLLRRPSAPPQTSP